MKLILNILLDFIIAYIFVFSLYWLIFVRKKTKFDQNKVPVEFYYLISIYKLDMKKINYKKFIYASALINCFIICFTYIVVFRLVDKWIFQLLISIVIIVLLIIICYGLLGKYYKKRCK